MNVLHGAYALARCDERILRSLLLLEADPAHHVRPLARIARRFGNGQVLVVERGAEATRDDPCTPLNACREADRRQAPSLLYVSPSLPLSAGALSLEYGARLHYLGIRLVDPKHVRRVLLEHGNRRLIQRYLAPIA